MSRYLRGPHIRAMTQLVILQSSQVFFPFTIKQYVRLASCTSLSAGYWKEKVLISKGHKDAMVHYPGRFSLTLEVRLHWQNKPCTCESLHNSMYPTPCQDSDTHTPHGGQSQKLSLEKWPPLPPNSRYVYEDSKLWFDLLQR